MTDDSPAGAPRRLSCAAALAASLFFGLLGLVLGGLIVAFALGRLDWPRTAAQATAGAATRAASTPPVAYRADFDTPGRWGRGVAEAEAGDGPAGVGQVRDGAYDLAVTTPRSLRWATAGEAFGAGVYELALRQVEGPETAGGGMMLLVDSRRERFYLFLLRGDGAVWIGYCSDGCNQREPLVGDGWLPVAGLRPAPGAASRLKVVADDGRLDFYVNDVAVGQVRDRRRRNGDIGVVVATAGAGGARFRFEAFVVAPYGEDN